MIAQIIKAELPNNLFIWKYPEENFNTLSQLVVHESQEAILFKNGMALDSFGPGRHTLSLENIPYLKNLINIPSGGETPFQCQVYFINRSAILNIKWGTTNRMLLQDPEFGITVPVGASGQFGVKVENGRKLLIELMGSMNFFDNNILIDYFKGFITKNIKEIISLKLNRERIGILQIYSFLTEISKEIENKLEKPFEKYGITLLNFFIDNIVIPESDPSYLILKDSLAQRAKFSILDTNYQQVRTFDILETAAANEGNSGSIMGAGVGLGLGVNFGEIMGNNLSKASRNIEEKNLGPLTDSQKIQSASTMKCKNCGEDIGVNSKFCSNCGEKV